MLLLRLRLRALLWMRLRGALVDRPLRGEGPPAPACAELRGGPAAFERPVLERHSQTQGGARTTHRARASCSDGIVLTSAWRLRKMFLRIAATQGEA
eukprot:9483721-Pyramimonas_sp.AAC.1